MADDITARKVVAQNLLTQSQTLFNSYNLTQASQAQQIQQATSLNSDVIAARAKLESLKRTSDTYDREFLDRIEAGQGSLTRLQRMGISTAQDIVLAGFFLSYALASLCVLLYVLIYSKTKLTAGLFVLFVSILFGIMMANLIVRFA